MSESSSSRTATSFPTWSPASSPMPPRPRRRWSGPRPRSSACSRGNSLMSIPVIDLGAYMAGAPGALERVGDELGAALETIGFFLIVSHGIERELIARTFAEARRFHAQPAEAKLALRMNEHNNGYMALGRYAVWTSDVNANDKPDLNEAFFVKRERPPDDPLVRAGRRFAGPNRWPDALPGFRETVLAYTEAVDALCRALLPLCGLALDLPAETFDAA